jgi:Skp family chaperone for outer membrane proteins
MSDELTKAREELDKEFNQFRENLGKIYEKLERVSQAGPTDDVSELLKDLEDTVGKVRTGGLVGSGAKGHREAREKYLKLQGIKP